MWSFAVLLIYYVGYCRGDTSANYFCADLNPQQHIIIDQLMGMWYAVETIDHKEERRYLIHSYTCPIIHISEDHTATTLNPLLKNYNRTQGYGRGGRYGTQTVPPDERYSQELYRQYRERLEYDRRTTYPGHPSRMNLDWIKPYEATKYLRLFWDESSDVSNEYHLRYKENQAGLWISSGSQDGVPIDPRYSHFTGTVQVLKAVGNHLVLTFCNRYPHHQLYTVILSRDPELENRQVHNIHSLLQGKGLSTHAVKKSCKNNGNRLTSTNLYSMLVLVFAYKLIGFVM